MRLRRELSGFMRLILLKTLHPHLLNHLQPRFYLLLLLIVRVIQYILEEAEHALVTGEVLLPFHNHSS